MKSFISYSGGIESTTMLAMFGKKSVPIFADTGFEHDFMYEWLDDVESRTGIKIVRVKSEHNDSETLPDYIRRYKYYPSDRNRFCTRRFKIEPIDKFLRSHLPCELMIGLNADEAGNRTGNLQMVDGVDYTYPLVDLGITREMCLEFLKEKGLMPAFPSYMVRGGCKGCFWKRKSEYIEMATASPQEADEVADLEAQIQDERGEWFSIRRGIKSIGALNRKARAIKSEQDAQGWLFDNSKEEQFAPMACGVFCNR